MSSVHRMIAGIARSPILTGGTIINDLVSITAVAGWGTVRRNVEYDGPALRVRDTVSLEEQDILFDVNGFVTAELPYGSNTRVIRIYDQWGNQHVNANNLTTIQVIAADAEFNTWRIHFTGTGGLQTPNHAQSGAAWAVPRMVWGLGTRRTYDNRANVREVWGVPTGGTYAMAIGMWEEYGDFHYRVNEQGPVEYLMTHWSNFPEENQNKFRSLVHDTSLSPNHGYLDGELVSTLNYTAPINYPTAQPLGIGDFSAPSWSVPWRGEFFELHIFSNPVAERASVDDIAKIANALEQVKTAVYP